MYSTNKHKKKSKPVLLNALLTFFITIFFKEGGGVKQLGVEMSKII